MSLRELPEDELALLGQTGQEFFAKAGGVDRARELRDAGGPTRFSAQLWSRIAELGWLGIQAPEEHGGADAGCRAMLQVAEAAGAALAPEPLLSATAAVRLLALAGTTEQRRRWLPPIIEGKAIPAVVGAHERRSREGAGGVRVVTGQNGPVLEGLVPYVLDGTVASVLLVLLDDPGPGLLVLPANSPGVRIGHRDLMDLRNWACVEFTGVPVPDTVPGGSEPALDRALDEMTVALAAEMLGGMWTLFDLTLEHARTRTQFGRPIGGFQALQHRLARLYGDLLLTDACVWEAAEALDGDLPEAPALASAAKLRCVASSRLVCRESVQLHGGMGVTDECDVGLYVKNLRVAEFFLGDQTWHADRWASPAAPIHDTGEVKR